MRGIFPNHTNFKYYVYASHASEVVTRKKHYWLHTFHDPKRSSILAKTNTNIFCSINRNPWLQVQRHKKPCDKLDYLSKWVCVSKFHANDYGSSRRSSHTKHSDTRKEFARDAFNKGTIELGFVPTAEHTTS